jgi:hypothetical protein
MRSPDEVMILIVAVLLFPGMKRMKVMGVPLGNQRTNYILSGSAIPKLMSYVKPG